MIFRLMYIIFILLATTKVFCEQQIILDPKEIVRIPQIQYGDLLNRDGPPEVIRPYFETGRGVVFILNDGICRLDDNFIPNVIKYSTVEAWAGSSSILSSNSFTVSGQFGISIYRQGDTYFPRVKHQVFGSIENVILIDNMVVREDGSSLLIDPTLNVIVLDRLDTLEYARTNIPGINVSGESLSYQGNTITGIPIQMIDDDGNFYDSSNLYRDGFLVNMFSLKSNGYWYRVFDHEGNLLAFKHSPDGIIVSYAGRTWGYRSPPRQAMVTSNNVRIRFRANTNSFILGMVHDTDSITVLKTGPIATIGTQTAPWYRIQTANGLVGWVFGAFVNILN